MLYYKTETELCRFQERKPTNTGDIQQKTLHLLSLIKMNGRHITVPAREVHKMTHNPILLLVGSLWSETDIEGFFGRGLRSLLVILYIGE